ncbi:MAG: hypothetical protein QOF61_2964, partial [Acidobacteriota bacterium]|nr:hypothetical protein [Acidobacteriota bacterium]
ESSRACAFKDTQLNLCCIKVND